MKLLSPQSQGYRLILRLFNQGHRIFTTELAQEAAMEEEIPRAQVNIILSRLVNQHIIKRLQRGLYVSLGLLGEVQTINPLVISTYMVRDSAISHWSALQYHGLTEQIPHIITASTPVVKCVGHLIVDGNKYQYITVQKKNFEFGLEEKWIDPHFCVRMTDKERTILDLFVYSSMFGGMGEVLGILEESLAELDVMKLIHYAILYDEKTTIKRIGWALEQLHVPEEEIKPLLDTPISSYCLLDPEKSSGGVYEKRWMIRNNMKEKYKK